MIATSLIPRLTGSVSTAAGFLALALLLPLSEAASGRDPRIPDVLVTTHDGTQVRFNSELIRGRIAVVDFVYTDCTFICVPQGRTFAGLAELLGDRLNRDVVLISVSLEPERDTPAALAKWVETVGGARPGWTLVTGDRAEIGKLVRVLGGVVTRPYHDGAAIIVHEPTNSWIRFNGTSAPAAVLRRIENVGVKKRPAE